MENVDLSISDTSPLISFFFLVVVEHLIRDRVEKIKKKMFQIDSSHQQNKSKEKRNYKNNDINLHLQNELGKTLQLQTSLDESIQKFLIDHLYFPSDLIFIIEEYYTRYEYILQMNDFLFFQNIYNNISFIVKIWKLFAYFLKLFYFLEEEPSTTSFPLPQHQIHLFEIHALKRKELEEQNKICASIFSIYRMVIQKDDINHIISKQWNNWTGQTKHIVYNCTCEKECKRKNCTFDRVLHPFYYLLGSLSSFFDEVMKNNLNLKITFYPDLENQ